MMPDALIPQFARARLDLKVTGAPLVRAGNSAIVQLDIARQPQSFLLWKGDAHNQIHVQNADRKLQQLVLFVKEPQRSFEVRVAREQVRGRRILRTDFNRRFVWVQEWTQVGQRHLLCGMDEQHYFVAQLPHGVATVQEAHRALSNPAAGATARANGTKLIRQGEWFFVRASHAEVDALTELHPLVRRGVATTDGSSVWRRGRPHVVDELVQLGPVKAGSPLRPGTVYVRGKVRHPDHRVLHLLEWHRVFGNHEASQPVGVQWAD